MRAWYLIYSRPRQERVALENLERQGYRSYLPLIRARRRAAEAVVPMFPRYLFVRLSDRTDDWGPIRSTIGVSGLVRFGALPARVPAELVESLRHTEDPAGVHLPARRDFKAGDPVLITHGVMAGFEAIFEARSGRERVTLLLEIAGKCARIQVDDSAVEPVRWGGR